jgi:DNA polymerase I-like protein with 3'-5' exonuclease and polymerase domains
MALTYLPPELNCVTTYPVLTVHDSILLETRDDPVLVARRLTEHMSRSYPFFGDVPMKADAKAGVRWGSLKEV